MKKRTSYILAALFLVVAMCWVFTAHSRGGEVLLKNDAQESIVKVTVEIGEQKFEFTNILPGETRTMKVSFGNEIRYKITVDFHYDRKVESQLGHLTVNANSRDELVVKDKEVVLETGSNQ